MYVQNKYNITCLCKYFDKKYNKKKEHKNKSTYNINNRSEIISE